ncbi:MAG: sigma-54-dependent transcriptional regulator [Candidatus Binataceae bacterium]
MERILIIDDEAEMLDNCQRILGAAGYECLTSADPNRALKILETDNPDLLFTDLRMPGMDGLEILRRARAIDALRPVIMLTAFATVESVVEAMKEGAFHYLAKPFTMDQLKLTAQRALEQRRLAVENASLREQLRGVFGFENIAGRSSALQQILEVVRKAAHSDANILVLGESGTGKELIARAIHANSARAAAPFIAVDCASLPENLLESELFGHEKGAFTGATAAKPGLMELADKGTLFLDEIGELPSGLQSKLLRALQERQIRRVGGTRPVNLNLRIVSATNRDLRSLLPDGKFREDLFYRINVIDIPVPPLRERKGDITLLAYLFLKRYSGRNGRPMAGFEPEAIAALESHAWPGNVRELQNVVERGCALADGEWISVSDLPENLRGASMPAEDIAAPDLSAAFTLKEAKARWIGRLESAYVTEVLRREGGNVSQAARKAGVDRKTLHRLLHKHSLR